MRRPYPTVHIEQEGSVLFPSGWVLGKPTLARGRLPFKSSTNNSHQAFKASAARNRRFRDGVRPEGAVCIPSRRASSSNSG